MWPTHAEPNDFWRMSPSGLEQLFGPSLGFETERAVGNLPAVVVPEPFWRSDAAAMPTTTSPAMSSIIARKIAPTPDVAWPLDVTESSLRARRYPVDGLLPAEGQG
jgi:hypothetical protein